MHAQLTSSRIMFHVISMNTHWTINQHEYLEAPGLAALLFHNYYPEGKQGGFEIIQHGDRVATNGDVRLGRTPGQWASFPKTDQRVVDAAGTVIAMPLRFEDVNLKYAIRVVADGKALRVIVDLEQPLSEDLIGKVSFNLELFPDSYFGKTFHLGETFGIFPRQFNGPKTIDAEGQFFSVPMAQGTTLSIAPEDPLRRMTIEAVSGGELNLVDGRSTADNNLFVVYAMLPAGVSSNAIEWRILPHSVPEWRKESIMCLSQVGYHPDQEKKALIEYDPRNHLTEQAMLERIDANGNMLPALPIQPEPWGQFLCNRYAVVDFTTVREPGMYRLKYGPLTSSPFRISKDVYQQNVWQPTLETFFPVQMCHMEVRNGARVWHGACHLDDALQAPTSHDHFDGYRQGDNPDTPYEPLTHIDGLNRGGWHDAGDYDLAGGSQAMTTLLLALIRETFGVDTDQTTIRPEERLVLLHTPDGTPDIIEQVKHGVENLLSGYRVVGHSFLGIIAGTLEQYMHLGDACTMTDNRVYDASLKPNEVVDNRSGKQDDRWVFTSRSTALEYQMATALAAASRVLRGYDDTLADECLETAIKIWKYEHSHEPSEHRSGYVFGSFQMQEVSAAIELLITTDDDAYRQCLLDVWPVIEQHIKHLDWALARVLPLIHNVAFETQVRSLIQVNAEVLKDELAQNPFGVPFEPRIWGIGWQIQRYAVSQYFLIQAFPDLFDRENVLRVLNYALGCHPGSSTSLVSGVGADSLTVAYGVNRADWSYIPGGNVSGPNLIRPNFPEMKPKPFIWQQTEYVMSGAATYMFCVLAADDLLNKGDTV